MGVACPERKRLGSRDRTFCFGALWVGDHPIVLVGLLPCAKWWRQRPLSPSEDKTKEGVSDCNLMTCDWLGGRFHHVKLSGRNLTSPLASTPRELLIQEDMGLYVIRNNF